jgi:alpha-L-fucosidase 2
MYGCRGFVCHHNTDLYGDTAPQDQWIPGTFWVMGAAWLCTHIWAHYEYTLDETFLAEHFPILCESALFFCDFLVPKDGFLVTCPSVSPENTFILPNGEQGANTYGVTKDHQILRDLFSQCLAAAKVLHLIPAAMDTMTIPASIQAALNEAQIPDLPAFLCDIEEKLRLLPPTRIASNGTLQEWMEEYEEAEPGHRHISHLYGLHPSSQILADETPELAAAARATLSKRLANGGGHTGWSRAWIINHYAKLCDPDAAYENLIQLFQTSTYPNLFDRHPPFQIDGNFGAAAGIAMMLAQSTTKRTLLLPALPTRWQRGQINGLRIRGNASLDLTWHDGELTSCTIHAESALHTKLYYRDRFYEVTITTGEEKIITLADFITPPATNAFPSVTDPTNRREGRGSS